MQNFWNNTQTQFFFLWRNEHCCNFSINFGFSRNHIRAISLFSLRVFRQTNQKEMGGNHYLNKNHSWKSERGKTKLKRQDRKKSTRQSRIILPATFKPVFKLFLKQTHQHQLQTFPIIPSTPNETSKRWPKSALITPSDKSHKFSSTWLVLNPNLPRLNHCVKYPKLTCKAT